MKDIIFLRSFRERFSLGRYFLFLLYHPFLIWRFGDPVKLSAQKQQQQGSLDKVRFTLVIS